ncbi:MAG: DUF3084 domain-containing protein [Pseudanabaenaceae cyanobacterium]
MGYILILATLLLGGLIATIGDRLGSRVGKARLSIFNLRPRTTATIVTIVTGAVISASTLGILIATSSQLRDGLFQLETIRNQLAETQTQKEKIEAELQNARREQEQAQQRLDRINRSLALALLRQAETQAQLQIVEGKFASAQQELAEIQAQEQSLRRQIEQLTTDQQKFLAESEKLKQERDRLNDDLQRITQERESLKSTVAESQSKLKELEEQRHNLLAEVNTLQASREQLIASIQALRMGNVAILADQLLAMGVVRPNLNRSELKSAIVQLLQQAEINARKLLDFLPNAEPKQPVLRITEAQIDSLVERMADGRSYVIRILSGGNYLRRETVVFVNADITPNRQVFSKGDVVASLQFRPNLGSAEIESRLEQLFLLASFRARREGLLADPLTGKVGSFSPTAINELLQTVSQYREPYEIQAVAKEPIFTASSLILELVLRVNGVEIRRFS